jgi:serine/threonine-protein kinase
MGGVAAERFGPYRLDELIGCGGMGEVYRVFDTVKQRTVALKRLPVALASNAEFQARFRRESALAARLSEPHIIPIHDYGEIDGRLFIEMRLVVGRDLARMLAEQGPMRPARAVDIVGQVARALDAAHADGLIHRDVKPSNVLITGKDGDEFAYLMDFGIARTSVDTGGSTLITAAGERVGTLDYMAPERFGEGPIDGRADVYSLACLLFQALTGAKPFRGEGLPAMVYAHLNLDPPRPSTQRPGVPVALDGVIARGMAKDPERRYPTAGALAAAARAALETPMAERDPPPVTPPLASTIVGSNPAASRTRPLAPPPLSQRAPAPAEETDLRASPRAPSRHRRISLIIIGLVVAIGALFTVTRDALQRLPATPLPHDAILTVIATISVGKAPEGVAVSPDGRRAYITNVDSRVVSVIDIGAGTVTASIRNGGARGVAVSPDGRRAYGVNHGSPGTLSVIDTDSGTIAATIPVGNVPEGVAVSPDGRRAYITNVLSDTVSVIDTMKSTVTATIPVGSAPYGVAVSPDGRHAYITNVSSNSVSVIDTMKSTVTTIPAGGHPWGVAVGPDGRHAYITNVDANTVSVIDTSSSTVTTTIPVGAYPDGVAVSPDGRGAYITNGNSNTVSVIDTSSSTVTTTIPVGNFPRAVAVSPDGRRVYITNGGSKTVSVIGIG